MDRLTCRRLARCGLGVIVMATGCRSTPSPVPPGRQFSNETAPAASFGSEPHPATGPSYGTAAPGTAVPGTTAPAMESPATGQYGPAPTMNPPSDPAPTMPSGPLTVPSPYGSAPSPASYGTMPSPGPGGGVPTAGMPSYGPAPSVFPAGSGAPAPAMDPAPGTAPAIPEDLPGIPAMGNPQ
jgi:hypothetical protein